MRDIWTERKPFTRLQKLGAYRRVVLQGATVELYDTVLK
jgi:hypothetical protein